MCVSAAMSGASAALTAVPPLAMFATGAAIVAIAWREVRARGDVRTAAVATLAGSCAGLLLPMEAATSGGVVAHPIGAGSDGDLFAAMDRLDEDPDSLIGRRITVSGEWTPAQKRRLATVSRRVMTCCAADAVDVGFDVEIVSGRPARGAWVRVSGVVRRRVSDGEIRYVLEQSKAAALEDSARTLH